MCSTAAAAAAAAATARSDLQLGVFYLLSVWRRSNPHLLLERCLISFSNVPKKLKTAEFAADDNLGEQLAEIVGSADCALLHQGRQLQMEENTCCLPSGGGEGCFWSKVRRVKQGYENVKEEDCSITKL